MAYRVKYNRTNTQTRGPLYHWRDREKTGDYEGDITKGLPLDFYFTFYLLTSNELIP